MRSLLFMFILVIWSITCSGCTPGLGGSLTVIEGGSPDSGGRVIISDQRQQESIGSFAGESLSADGSVTAAVEKAVHDELLERDLAGVLRGSIEDWYVDVQEEFPSSTASARAALTLEVWNQGGEVVYRGRYSGNVSTKRPFLSRSEIEETLQGALDEALNAGFADRSLVDALYDSAAGGFSG